MRTFYSRGLVVVLVFLHVLSVQASSDAKSLSITLDKGNLLSIIEPKQLRTEESKAASKRYYDVAINLAQSYGYRNRGVLRVTDTLEGDVYPTTFVLASWPNPEADATFESLPEWQEYKALRPAIWETLKFYKSPVNETKQLEFHTDKSYTISFLWLSEKGEGEFETFKDKTAGALQRAGGKQIHIMQAPRFDTHSAPFHGPDLVTITEWANEAGYQDFVSSNAYNQNKSKLTRFMEKQDVYRVMPVIR